MLIALFLLPLGASIDAIKGTVLLLLIPLMPPAVVVLAIWRGVKKVEKGFGFMLTITIIEAALASFGFFGLSGTMVFAGIVIGIFTIMLTRPKDKTPRWKEVMRSSSWWMVLAFLWLGFLGYLVKDQISDAGAVFTVFLGISALSLSIIIPILKLAAGHKCPRMHAGII